MRTVLDYIAEHHEISETELQELLGIKRTRSFTLTKQMSDAGLIKIIGRGSDKKYVNSTY